jgi:MoaA/NifB/PqqE/SkfB family radical SAM enzyme
MDRYRHILIKWAVGLGRLFLSDRASLPHLMAFFRYNTLLKAVNLTRVMLEMKLGRVRVKGKPFIMFLEVNNICNLHCPFCLTGKGTTLDRPKRNMSLEEMKKSIEAVTDYLYFIQLYNWGEPLLNKDLFEFIQYAHQRRIFTMVSSNMNFIRPGLAEQIVDSGLDYFISAIDGFSPESYVKYRRGGDFEKAIRNMEDVLAKRKRKGMDHPFVEWQYVVFRHNQHELEAARTFADRIGVDYFHPIAGYIEDPEWITDLPDFQAELGLPASVAKCVRPWTHLNIRADGGVAVCCYEFFKKDDFGNIFEKPFARIWNNEMFISSRKLLSRGPDKAPDTPATICHGCVASGIRPSFQELE